MDKKLTLIKKGAVGLFSLISAVCISACSEVNVNWGALKDMLSPVKEGEKQQSDKELPKNPQDNVENKDPEIPEEPEIPETPEEPVGPKTEEEYKIACKDKFEEFALAIAKYNSRSVETIFNVENLVYNVKNGALFFTTNGKYYTSKRSFFYMVKDEELSEILSYKELFDKISELSNTSKLKEVYVEREELISHYASQENCENFVEYIVNEISSMQKDVNIADCKVLNISPFISFIKGKYKAEIVAICGNKEYYLTIKTTSDTNNDDECIKGILNGAETTITIKKEAEFKSFNEIGQALEEEEKAEQEVEEIQPTNAASGKKFSKKLCLKNVAVELDKQENGKWVINFDSHDEKLFNNDKTLRGSNNAVVEPKKVVKEKGFAGCGASL